MAKELNAFTVMQNMNTYMTNNYNGRKQNNYQKLYTEEDIKNVGLSSYLLLHFIKNHPILINVSLYLNENWKHMSIYDMYLFVYFSFNYLSIGDVRWVKSNGRIKSPEDVKLFMRHYRVNRRIAEHYIDTLDKKDILEIKKIYNPKVKK